MAREDRDPHPGVSGREFVGLIAALMAIGALGIDTMLPALPQIGRSLHAASENSVQYVILAYTFGFGFGQLLFGPLADRYGRKPVLVGSLIGFVAMSMLAALVGGFAMLIAVRIVQGGFGAATRVLVSSIVRDCYSGRRMARVMSLAGMFFFIVPILAPALGTGLLLVGSWRLVFWTLAALGTAILLWTAWRLPETLNPASRRTISLATLKQAYGATLGNRLSLGYATGGALTFGALIGYVSSSEQIVAGTFHAPTAFPYVFATIAGAMGFSVFVNSRLVERFGTRKLSHGAVLAVITVSFIHLLVALLRYETLSTFVTLQALQLAAFGLIGSNFSAMAMSPLGHIAGTASSIQGFISNVGAATIGAVIGQQYDGTTIPLQAGFVVAGVAALGVVLIAERGRLFVAHDAQPRPLAVKRGG